MADIIINDKVIRGIELFVFDKDGTLIDLYNYWYNMVKLRAEKICDFYNLLPAPHVNNLMFEMGVDIEKGKLRPQGPVGLLPREAVQKAAEKYLLNLGCQDVPRVCFRIFKEVDEISLPLLSNFIRPLGGAIKLLADIKARKARIAMATTDRTERAELAVKFMNITSLIDIIVGADKVKNSKPAPDMLEFIAEKLNVLPSRSVMIGDAETDIEMGVNAGFKASIAVCSGLTDKNALSMLTPYVIEDISKLRIE